MNQTPFINYRSMGFSTEEESTMTVLRGHAQFFVRVQIARVKDTHFGDQLSQERKLGHGCSFRKFGSFSSPLEPVYQYCLPLFERIAPQTILHDLSLESFLHSPTYHLELVGIGMNGDIRIEGEETSSHTPSFFISPMRTVELPHFCKMIPFFLARTICIVPSGDGKSLSSVQGRVVTANGNLMFFKPRLEGREGEFERELQILSRIKEAGLHDRLRVPELLGIVVAGEDGEKTMGILTNLIMSPEMVSHLQSQGLWGEIELHKKWEEQVAVIVQELHANGIVWGDVNPMNIVIDERRDAWVVDFGGMNNVEFVDDENRETVEGDKQGILRLFQEWLPSRLSLTREKQ